MRTPIVSAPLTYPAICAAAPIVEAVLEARAAYRKGDKP